MKPLGHNNLSAWGYIGLFILFSLPYIGTPALIICAIFARDPAVKSFSRALIILALIGVALVAASFILLFTLGNFDFSFDDGVQALGNLRGYLGF